MQLAVIIFHFTAVDISIAVTLKSKKVLRSDLWIVLKYELPQNNFQNYNIPPKT